jgi:hypothetical protein
MQLRSFMGKEVFAAWWDDASRAVHTDPICQLFWSLRNPLITKACSTSTAPSRTGSASNPPRGRQPCERTAPLLPRALAGRVFQPHRVSEVLENPAS